MDNKKILAIISAIAKKIEAEKDFLTQLDNEIGDGDHGINLARGFKSVEEKLPTFADKDIGAILKGVGTQLVSTVGGASGPLYGTAFMSLRLFSYLMKRKLVILSLLKLLVSS